MCKFSKIGVENNRGGKSISAVHGNIYIQAKWLKIGNEKKNKASINTVLTSTTKFDINSKISFVFFIKLGFPCKAIQIVRVPGNNFVIVIIYFVRMYKSNTNR